MDSALTVAIHSRAEFQAALRQAFADIATAGTREIWLCDADFSDWPLGDVQVVAHLSQWAVAHRTCTVLASDYAPLSRHHPRWVQWRRQRSHVVHCHAPDDSHTLALPCLLIAPGTATLRLIDRTNWRGSVSSAMPDAQREREQLDALLQRSVAAFPASTLGL